MPDRIANGEGDDTTPFRLLLNIPRTMSSFRQDPSLTAPPSILKNLMSSNSFKMDEGYSEDTRSQSGSDVAFRNMEDQIDQDQQIVLPEGWAAASEEERLGNADTPRPGP